jgi:hypothetical protein
MKNIMRIGLVLAVCAFVLLAILALTVRLRYGGGASYPDLTGDPILPDEAVEIAATYHEPIGNVAVSDNGRLFFTAHPEARPVGPRLLEWVDGTAVPIPSAELQAELFRTPLGVAVDRQERLWVVDHADHGAGTARLLAFSLATGEVVHDIPFDGAIAPLGSFLQDLQVTPDGATVVIADVSFWRKSPALVVVDVATGAARRVLERHPSVMPQDWIVETAAKRMVFFAGLAALKPGVDGIAMDPNGRWLAYGAMTHDSLYRVPLEALLDSDLAPNALAAQVENLGAKPAVRRPQRGHRGRHLDHRRGARCRRAPRARRHPRNLGEDTAYPLGRRPLLGPRRLALRGRLGHPGADAPVT